MVVIFFECMNMIYVKICFNMTGDFEFLMFVLLGC